jgi:hypothetical protein
LTPEDAAAFWAELQRALRQVGHVRKKPDWRRRRAGEMRVTVTERRAMQAFHLLHDQTYTALAARFQRDRHYMGRWIWEPRYIAFHRYYWGTLERPHTTGRRPAAPVVDRPAA